eukprot:TRINITY_DN39330_c0_g1_i1.p1 TRINITY_DN39330_c0_g1~~TRINITY_DN39330_c0_g1_i1.p1  ORF type:complete len:463 (+),score=39.67 TRINITY_DN39330_c0_g1_i1:74-1462(+)
MVEDPGILLNTASLDGKKHSGLPGSRTFTSSSPSAQTMRQKLREFAQNECAAKGHKSPTPAELLRFHPSELPFPRPHNVKPTAQCSLPDRLVANRILGIETGNPDAVMSALDALSQEDAWWLQGGRNVPGRDPSRWWLEFGFGEAPQPPPAEKARWMPIGAASGAHTTTPPRSAVPLRNLGTRPGGWPRQERAKSAPHKKSRQQAVDNKDKAKWEAHKLLTVVHHLCGLKSLTMDALIAAGQTLSEEEKRLLNQHGVPGRRLQDWWLESDLAKVTHHLIQVEPLAQHSFLAASERLLHQDAFSSDWHSVKEQNPKRWFMDAGLRKLLKHLLGMEVAASDALAASLEALSGQETTVCHDGPSWMEVGAAWGVRGTMTPQSKVRGTHEGYPQSRHSRTVTGNGRHGTARSPSKPRGVRRHAKPKDFVLYSSGVATSDWSACGRRTRAALMASFVRCFGSSWLVH